MILTYKDLKKREVVNVADGKSLGSICNLALNFPSGTLAGIYVPGKKSRWLFKIFDKCELFIEESKISKIGSDVILVNLKCGELCSESASVKVRQEKNNCCPPTPCVPNSCPQKPPTCEQLFGTAKGVDNRIDEDDYMWF